MPTPRLANIPRTRHKACVKDGHTTHGESSFGKKLWCVLIVLFLGGIGWQMWKLNAYNNAVREAKEAGFEWKCDDAFSLIKQDWRNAFKKETWGAHPRVLDMAAREVPHLGRYREMLHHLRPTVLSAWGCKDENADALKGLTGLQSLYLLDCTALQNVDALKGLTGLQTLYLSGCRAMQNLDALKGLPALQTLDLVAFPALQNVDGLKDHAGLQKLDIWNCPALQNVDELKSLTALQTLTIKGCPALQNVDAIKGLTTLRTLTLDGCDKIPAAALDELSAALPNLQINPTIPGP